MRKAILILLVVAILVAVLIPVGLEVNYRRTAKKAPIQPLAAWWGGVTGLVSKERAAWHDEAVLFAVLLLTTDAYIEVTNARTALLVDPQETDAMRRGLYITPAGTTYAGRAQRYATLCIAETRRAQQDRFISEQARVVLEMAEQECVNWMNANYTRNTPPVVAQWLEQSWGAK